MKPVEPRLVGAGHVHDPDDLLLKALVQYVISRFGIHELEYVLEFYKEEIKKRTEEDEKVATA